MPYINGKYYTQKELDEIKRQQESNETEEFLTSAVVGAVTGSSIVGGIVGGSFTGGLLGDILEGTDDSIF